MSRRVTISDYSDDGELLSTRSLDTLQPRRPRRDTDELLVEIDAVLAQQLVRAS